MKKFYCPECGKQGCGFLYVWVAILVGVGMFIGAVLWKV